MALVVMPHLYPVIITELANLLRFLLGMRLFNTTAKQGGAEQDDRFFHGNSLCVTQFASTAGGTLGLSLTLGPLDGRQPTVEGGAVAAGTPDLTNMAFNSFIQ